MATETLRAFLLIGLLMGVAAAFARAPLAIARLRVDQLMAFAWKFLMPLAFVRILAAGTCFRAPRWTARPASAALVAAAYLVLTRISRPGRSRPREYRYSD